jgi:hypothetical protein
MAEAANLSKVDAEYICQELVRRGFLESYVLTGIGPAIGFIDFLTEFWDWGKNPPTLRRSCGRTTASTGCIVTSRGTM